MLTPNQEHTSSKQPTYSVKNLVARVDMELVGEEKLDLISILNVNPLISKYDPNSNFPGLIMKIETSTPRGIIKGTALIFTSGTLILTGLRTENHTTLF